MKKAYTRTEIIKFINKLEKELNRNITPNDIFDNSKKLFEHLKQDTENPIGNCDYHQFMEAMKLGFMIAQSQGVHFHV